jgi:hypothetical protein
MEDVMGKGGLICGSSGAGPTVSFPNTIAKLLGTKVQVVAGPAAAIRPTASRRVTSRSGLPIAVPGAKQAALLVAPLVSGGAQPVDRPGECRLQFHPAARLLRTSSTSPTQEPTNVLRTPLPVAMPIWPMAMESLERAGGGGTSA